MGKIGFKRKKPYFRYNGSWYRWCDRVTEQVRFRPDHHAIRQELMAHMEDCAADLERLGYDAKTAEERALKAMGDPASVGKALDKAHKPWLGWLWRASRWLAAGLLLLALIACFSGNHLEIFLSRLGGQLRWTEPPAYADRAETAHAVLWLASGEITEKDGVFQADMELWAEMHSPAHRSAEWMGHVTVTTDQGELPTQLRNENGYWAESGYYGWTESTEGWTRYHCNIRLVLEEPPKWAEVRYPYGDNDWVLRAEWGDG